VRVRRTLEHLHPTCCVHRRFMLPCVAVCVDKAAGGAMLLSTDTEKFAHYSSMLAVLVMHYFCADSLVRASQFAPCQSQ